MMKNKMLISLVTVLTLTLSLATGVKSDTKPIVHIDNANFSDETSGWGKCRIYGWLDNLIDNKDTHEISLLVYKDDGHLDAEDIAYVDQVTTSANDTFLFEFGLRDSLIVMDSTLKCKIGNNAGADVWSQDFVIPFTDECHLENLANNTVFYGCDAYSLSSNNLTGDTVAKSIINGGNRIYYKLGDKWYDLLDEKATSNKFLTNVNNATSTSKVQEVIVNGTSKYYYFNDYIADLLK